MVSQHVTFIFWQKKRRAVKLGACLKLGSIYSPSAKVGRVLVFNLEGVRIWIGKDRASSIGDVGVKLVYCGRFVNHP